ncbi:MAG: ABC transporter permease [Thermoleophilia bacterium]|nr:ABC transporter permease [Thermoleophilia bacterium]MDH4341049.1 ABC transporter permease [Thermoleophilia bacterium]
MTEQVPATSGAVTAPAERLGSSADLSLSYESGLELKARSQWAYARMRFLRHRLAVGSLIILILIGFVAIFAKQVAPHGFNDQDLVNIAAAPSWDHPFGTDLLGRDYLSRVIYGLRTSLWVAFFVALLSTAFGTAVGAVAGYYGGTTDNLLMRFTDLILTLPGLAVLLTAAAFLGQQSQSIGPISISQPVMIGLILAFLFWTGLARIVRGVYLSLREKEFVEAAKASGAGDMRIMVRHILPNCVGPIVVTMTLIIATAILVEAALSFLGFGIQPPNPALGSLIAEGNVGGLGYWWLVTYPGLVIVIIALAVNFIGDGLRDALDPTQRLRA